MTHWMVDEGPGHLRSMGTYLANRMKVLSHVRVDDEDQGLRIVWSSDTPVALWPLCML